MITILKHFRILPDVHVLCSILCSLKVLCLLHSGDQTVDCNGVPGRWISSRSGELHTVQHILTYYMLKDYELHVHAYKQIRRTVCMFILHSQTSGR